MSFNRKEKYPLLKSLLGLPAFVAVAALLWWQWKQLHYLALASFLALDQHLTFPGIPPLMAYALVGAWLAVSLALFQQDRRLIAGWLRWRALLLPVLLLVWLWQPHVSPAKHPVSPTQTQKKHPPK